MAIQFDGSTDYYTTSDDAALTLGDEDWCVGIWTNVADNTGTDLQTVISNSDNAGSSPGLNVFLRGEDVLSPDVWRAVIRDGSSSVVLETSVTGGDSTDRLIIIQRNTADSLMTIHFCEPGQTATLEDSTSDASEGSSNGGDWVVGRRLDGSAGRWYRSIAGEFFVGKFNLSLAEITTMGAGATIWELGKTPVVYQPMPTAGHNQIDLFGTHDGAETGTPATVEHFKVGLPRVSGITRDAAAAPAGRIMSSLAGSGGLAHKGGIAGAGGGLAG